MSEFTDEIIENLKERINKNYEERAKVIKTITSEYYKNTLVIYDEIKKEISENIEDLMYNLESKKELYSDIYFYDINEEIFEEEKSRLLQEKGLKMTYEDYAYIKEKDAFRAMVLSDEYEGLYGTVDPSYHNRTVIFNKKALMNLINKEDLLHKYCDRENDDRYKIRVYMEVPEITSLLTENNQKENKKLKIYKKTNNTNH